jgi:hypothetical protein
MQTIVEGTPAVLVSRTIEMMDKLFFALAPIIGVAIAATLLFLLAVPLLIGLLMAFRFLRYREWLAMLAVAWSMVILTASGDFLYNLMNWSPSRFSPGTYIPTCAVVFVTPPFLFILILIRSRRRWVWGLGIVLLTSLSLISIRNEFVARRERDAEAYRQGIKPLSPRTGTSLVRWWRDYRGQHEKVLLQGHIPEATAVVLLTDPFSRSFQPHFCNGVASTYWPPVKDPADLGNATEVAGLKGCDKTWPYGVAVLERGVAIYAAVPFQPLSGELDRQVFAHPSVRKAFDKLSYDPANFDASKAVLSQAIGLRQTNIFITALKPIRMPPNAFPCADPALLVSVHDRGNVQAVIPFCALSWNLFQLDDALYFAATTQYPTPPAPDLMNPDGAAWLFHVEGTELKQLWPAS